MRLKERFAVRIVLGRVGVHCGRCGQRAPPPIVAYMDVDLSMQLNTLPPARGAASASPITATSRSAPVSPPAHVLFRGQKREVISRTYNMLLKATMRSGFSDAQCGFKAVRADVARALLPMIEDQEWFFDTELLLLAEHNGLRIHEVPVDWVDDADSRVDVFGTCWHRPARHLAHGPVGRDGTGGACALGTGRPGLSRAPDRDDRRRSRRSARALCVDRDRQHDRVRGAVRRVVAADRALRCRRRYALTICSLANHAANPFIPSRCADDRDARGTTRPASRSRPCRSPSPCSRSRFSPPSGARRCSRRSSRSPR